MKTQWYEFPQNNSGGEFRAPALHVYIEAESAEVACTVAAGHGVYFDGCEEGLDCDCCGDRWSRPYWSRPYGSEDTRPEPEYERENRALYSRWAKEAGALALWVYADGRTETEVA